MQITRKKKEEINTIEEKFGAKRANDSNVCIVFATDLFVF